MRGLSQELSECPELLRDSLEEGSELEEEESKESMFQVTFSRHADRQSFTFEVCRPVRSDIGVCAFSSLESFKAFFLFR